LGDGKKVKFWKNTWVGDRSLKNTYPRLFSISECKENTMTKLRVGEEENPLHTYGWNLGWDQVINKVQSRLSR